MEGYRTIYEGASIETTVKKSRFIATVLHAECEEEALYKIEALRKKYWDASHNCYAYTVGAENPVMRCSDDGEPARTAGRPILDVLTGENLKNSLAVVTRYFGGTLLGTGGLVRAYQGAAKAGFTNSQIIERLPAKKLIVTVSYSLLGKLQYAAAQYNIPLLGTEYTDKAVCTLLADDAQHRSFYKSMMESASGNIDIAVDGEIMYARHGKEILTFNN